jgi:hypothetical protein
MKDMRAAALSVLASLACTSAHAGSLTVGCGENLSITAVIDTTAKTMPAGSKSPSRLNGTLKVSNGGNALTHYSNRYAKLNGAHAYVNSVASHIVDSGTIPVQPGATLEFDVYWPSEMKPGTVANQLMFECNRKT